MGVRGGAATLRPGVFFDRDGVLNAAVIRAGHPFPPSTVEELLIDPDAPGAVQRLRDLGFAIVIVTNQPDVARGTTTARIVEAINERVATAIRADGVYTCFHDRQDDCECRKPRPGMLLTAAAKHRLELGRSYMVGDRWSDIAAGRDARCRTVWIERGYDEQAPTNPDARCSSLLNACNWIIDDFTK